MTVTQHNPFQALATTTTAALVVLTTAGILATHDPTLLGVHALAATPYCTVGQGLVTCGVSAGEANHVLATLLLGGLTATLAGYAAGRIRG
jgi:hypothetical protein